MSSSSVQTAVLLPSGILQFTHSTGDSLNDVVEPDGVYTVTQTHHRIKSLLLDAHLDRLEESARLENIPLRLDRAQLRRALRKLIDVTGYPESRFRITIPRDNPEQIYFALEHLLPIPDSIRRDGVRVAGIHAQRHNPAAKSTVWISQRKAATFNLPPEIYQAFLVNDSREILEGTSSNFYAVLDGELRTAEKDVLKGISRRALLQCVEGLLPIHLEPVTLDDIPKLSEAFLTSSTRGVIPIVEFDGEQIGTGKPGDITRELTRRYDAWTEAHLEPI